MRAIARDARVLKSLSADLREDAAFIEAAVRANGAALAFVPPELQEDFDVALAAVLSDSSALKFIPRALRADASFFLRAAQGGARGVLRAAAPSLRSSRAFVLQLMDYDGCSIEFAREEFRRDRTIATSAVAHAGGAALKSLPVDLRGDRGVALAAMRREGLALSFAAESLQGDREVVAAAVRSDWRALGFAAGPLRTDRALILEAMQSVGYTLADVAAFRKIVLDSDRRREGSLYDFAQLIEGVDLACLS